TARKWNSTCLVTSHLNLRGQVWRRRCLRKFIRQGKRANTQIMASGNDLASSQLSKHHEKNVFHADPDRRSLYGLSPEAGRGRSSGVAPSTILRFLVR